MGLQCQTPLRFKLENFICFKKCWVQKILDPKKFWVQLILGSNFFRLRILFGTKWLFAWNIFLGLTNFHGKYIFGSNKFLGKETFFSAKQNFVSKQIYSEKKF